MQKHFCRRFATRAAPPDLRRPGPWSGKAPLSRNQLGKARLSKTHGFLGHGSALQTNYKRRWRGGRYNYFDWNTLLQCINRCPSVIERDRMPSPQELNHYYRGAQIGVRHHGGFDVVACILNLAPYRKYLINPDEYPTWIEQEWIEKKMNENSITTSQHRHIIPDYLRKQNYDTKIKNIRGKYLTKRDKQDIARNLYKKININDYEYDVEQRSEIKKEFDLNKMKKRDEIILNEYKLGLLPNGIRQRNKDGTLVRNEFVDSQKHGHFNKELYSANDQHILLDDSSHISIEEKQIKQTRRQQIKNRLSALMKRKKKTK